MKPEQKIREAVTRSGITLANLSRRSGVPYSKIQPAMRGRRELRADEYLAICAVLRLDPRTAEEVGQTDVAEA